MNWAIIVGRITGAVDEHVLRSLEYTLKENRIYRGRFHGRFTFTDAERIELANAAKPIGRVLLADIATLVTPVTLLRWHRRLVENVASRQRPADLMPVGRPATDSIIVELVLRFARENRSWGYDRIVDALAELGHVISDSTVGNILREHGIDPAPERKRQPTWADFIATHKDVLLGCDFFTKEVWTLLGPVTYYVLFFIHIASRKVYIAGMTTHPNEQWMQQAARNITMADEGFANGMKYVILDRDSKHSESFRAILESADVECLRLPPRSPNLNAYAERFVRSIKEECLDKLILFGEGSLQRAIHEFVEHYHVERPHQGKRNTILFPSSPATESGPARALAGCSSSTTARQRNTPTRNFRPCTSHTARREVAMPFTFQRTRQPYRPGPSISFGLPGSPIITIRVCPPLFCLGPII
jgi:putative transposase